jgi:methylase of polypeptide subunit release factors
MPATTHIEWTTPDGQIHRALWRSEAGVHAPGKVQVADDTMPADRAYKLACEGTALMWQGDFQNARHLLQALTRRLDKQAERAHHKPAAKASLTSQRSVASPDDMAQAFHKHRQTQGHRARILGMLLLPFEADHRIPLRRAPDVHQACTEAYGPGTEPYVASLRELLGLIGAHEWRKKGVPIPALNGRIHAHYGVFSPVRGEYVDLVAKAPLPAGATTAFDVGTGTGVLAAVLARRGFKSVVATDQDARALACAHENLVRLGLASKVHIVQANLFPPGQADVVLCNPPWVPARPSSPLEYAVYDPDSAMLRGFLAGLREHLAPGGEGWLIISDLAEHLGLRSRAQLEQWIGEAGLRVLGRLDTRPRHAKTQDSTDPLHQARAAEVTSLWRLGAKEQAPFAHV